MKNGGYEARIQKEDLKSWFEYNFNDCYYTY